MSEVKAEVKETKETEDVQAKEEGPPVKNISIEEVLNQYPIDRDKARDVLLIEISKSLIRIASSLEVLPQALLGISQKLENLDKKRTGPRVGPG